MKQKINKFIGALLLSLGLFGAVHVNAQTILQDKSTTFICQNTVSYFRISGANAVGCMVNSKTGPGNCSVNCSTTDGTFNITITGQLSVVLQTIVVTGYPSVVQISSYGLFISGPSVLCPPTTATYTNSGQSLYGTLSWTFPAFMTGPAPGYNPTKPQPVTDNSNGTGNVVITGTGGVCPAGNASNICVFPVISGAPGMPAPVHYIQETNQCYFNPYVAALPAATDYQWSTSNFANGLDDEGNTPRSVLEFLPNTHVTMYVRCSNGCGTGLTRMTTMNTPPTPPGCVYRINETTGIAPEKEIKEVNVYPNPAGNMFKLDLPGAGNKVEVRILNMEGALVKSFTTSESTLEVGTEDMPSGLYIIQLNAASFHETKKIQILK